MSSHNRAEASWIDFPVPFGAMRERAAGGARWWMMRPARTRSSERCVAYRNREEPPFADHVDPQRRRLDLDPPIPPTHFQRHAGFEAGLAPDRSRNDQPPGRVDGSIHGRKVETVPTNRAFAAPRVSHRRPRRDGPRAAGGGRRRWPRACRRGRAHRRSAASRVRWAPARARSAARWRAPSRP